MSTTLNSLSSVSSRPAVSERRGHIQAAEWRFVWAVIVGLLAITTLPLAYAYLSTPPGQQFMGIMLNVPDHVQYFSWYRQYLTQDLASNLLTSEPNAPVFFNLLWWLLGRAGGLLGWDYAAMFQVLRVVATTAFLIVLYRLCAWFLPDLLMRRTAFLVAIFTCGFGWVLIAAKYLFHLDEYPLFVNLLIYIVEPNTFFAMLTTPHLVGAALYIFAFDLVLRAEAEGRWRYAVAAGLFTCFLGWQHAYDLFLVYGILGAYALLKLARDRRLPWFLIGSLIVVGVLSVWPALYSVLLTSLDPIWRDVLAQFDNAGVFTPNPLLLPVLLGPAFLLALFTLFKQGVFKLRGLPAPASHAAGPLAPSGQVDDNGLFLRAWFWANFLLVYVPTNYQIKMLNGWQVPIAILATQGLFQYVGPWLRRVARGGAWSDAAWRRGLAAALLIVVLPTNLYLWAWRFVDLRRHTYPYYLSTDEVQALDWLAAHGTGHDVVLASLTLGQYIPALTGERAVLAHWAQTVDYYTKEQAVAEYYAAGTADARRQALARQYGVDYVLLGPAERALGGAPLATSPGLQKVFSAGAVDVYAVRK